MSVQLILYPQSFNGEINNLSYSPDELLVNGLYFTNLSSSASYDASVSSAGNLILAVLTNSPPTTVNTWYRFRNTYYGTPALPTNNSAGNLVLNSLAALSLTGIYQKLSNLTIGQSYTVTINITTPSVGIVGIYIYNGLVQTYFDTGAAASSTITKPFTATS